MSISDANSNVEPFPNHQTNSLAKLVSIACVTNAHSKHFESRTTTETKAEATTTTTTTTATKMPGETLTNNTTTAAMVAVAVANSSATSLPSTTDQAHDSDEQDDFDQTTKTFGAHNWIFNYKDVSFSLPFSVFFDWGRRFCRIGIRVWM